MPQKFQASTGSRSHSHCWGLLIPPGYRRQIIDDSRVLFYKGLDLCSSFLSYHFGSVENGVEAFSEVQKNVDA